MADNGWISPWAFQNNALSSDDRGRSAMQDGYILRRMLSSEITFAGANSLKVAASNSSTAARNDADYVCDGVNDEVQIQAAFDALTAGGRLFFYAGNYIVEAPVTIPLVPGIDWGGESIRSTAFETPAAGIAGPMFAFFDPTGLNQYHRFHDFRIYGENNTPGYLADLSQTSCFAHNLLENVMMECTNTSVIFNFDGNEDSRTKDTVIVHTVGSADTSVRWSVPDGGASDEGSRWDGAIVQAQQFSFLGTVWGGAATQQAVNLYPTVHGANYNFVGCYANGIPLPFCYLKASAGATEKVHVNFDSCSLALDNPASLIDSVNDFLVDVTFKNVVIINTNAAPAAFPMFNDFTGRTIWGADQITSVGAGGLTLPTVAQGKATVRVATGSYIGNDANSRQIVTGFKCGRVMISATGVRAALGNGTVEISAHHVLMHISGFHDATVGNAGLALHATDGFIVGDAAGTDYTMNVSTSWNDWIAWGE